MVQIPLNFDWHYKAVYEQGDEQGFQGVSVDVPHTVKPIPNGYFDETITHTVASYFKTVTIDKCPEKRYFLRFEAVTSKAVVSINGNNVFEHVGGFTAFLVEITDAIHQGENGVHVKVDAREEADHPPFGNVVDFLTTGGLTREVALIETDKDFIEYALIDGDQHTLNVRLKGNALTDTVYAIDVRIKDGDETVMAFGNKHALHEAIEFHMPHQLTLWTLKHPKLYHAVVYMNNQEVYKTRFGVRTVHADKFHFYLNGEKVFLRGLNRHQSYPHVGYAMPSRAQKDDADHLKDTLGVIMVRSSHYPPSRHFLDRADEIGLLVFTEITGWQHIGDDDWKAHAINELKALTLEGYNHPSVVIVGTRINESKDDDAFYEKTRDTFKAIDQSRLSGGVRYIDKSHLLEDIYTYNDFSYNGKTRPIKPKRHVTKSKHPYLITEFNGHMFPTKCFDVESRRLEHAMRHFDVLNAAYGSKGVMGALGWCMNDYHTHASFGSNDHVCHHGVNDMGRVDKYAAAAYASQRETPYMNVLSAMHIGDREAGALKRVVVATNCDAVRLYKNSHLIGTFYPNRKQYKHLPHPPVMIDDFIGDAIEREENFSTKDAKRVKALLLKVMRNDLAFSLLDKLKLGRIMLKYKMNYEDAASLYTRHIGGWGSEGNRFVFEGIKDGNVVKTQTKGRNDAWHIKATTKTTSLYHGDTYDVARVVIEQVNAYDERAVYAGTIVHVKSEGAIDVIGPSQDTLLGGALAVYVRTTKQGHGSLTIESDYGKEIIKFTVQ